jgi:hypothetical protein
LLQAQVSREAGHFNDTDSYFYGCLMGGAAVGRSYSILPFPSVRYSILPYPSVRMFLGGGVPAGLVGGWHTQPGSTDSTRTPIPAWETTLVTSAKGDAGPSPHQGQPVKLLGIPEGQRYRSGVATSLYTMLQHGGDNPLVMGGQAAEPSSRLTCSATNRLGLPARQGLFPLVRVPDRLRAVLTLCGCGLSLFERDMRPM